MEVIVLDNGLVGRGEHSYQLLLEVCGALARRAVSYRVFGLRRMDDAVMADIGAIPWFRRSLYWAMVAGSRCCPISRQAALRWRVTLRRCGGSTAKTRPGGFQTTPTGGISKSCRRMSGAAEISLSCPGISQNQILGLVQQLLSLPRETLPKVVCQLMLPPNWTPWHRNGEHGDAYYRQAFELAGGLIGTALFFTAENGAVADMYLKRFGIVTKLLPIATRAPQRAPRPGVRTRLGFFGYSKSEKGFHLLPETIAICLRRNLAVDFIVQVQHTRWESETIEAERKLRRFPGVEIVEGAMDVSRYVQMTNAADVTLLPYDPQRFGLRGSGIYTEAVVAGRPIIAAKGLYAAVQIERGEAEGEIFAPYGSEPLANAIEKLLPRLSECRARAASRAAEFASRHSCDAYVEVLLNLAGR